MATNYCFTLALLATSIFSPVDAVSTEDSENICEGSSCPAASTGAALLQVRGIRSKGASKRETQEDVKEENFGNSKDSFLATERFGLFGPKRQAAMERARLAKLYTGQCIIDTTSSQDVYGDWHEDSTIPSEIEGEESMLIEKAAGNETFMGKPRGDPCLTMCYMAYAGKCLYSKDCDNRYVPRFGKYAKCHFNRRGKCHIEGFRAGFCPTDTDFLKLCKDVKAPRDLFGQKCNHMCTDEGKDVCRYCGRHDGNWMRCCSMMKEYKEGDPCYGVKFADMSPDEKAAMEAEKKRRSQPQGGGGGGRRGRRRGRR
eukprot:gnl/TRDRNA2_/TRDRNA2_154199_c0_seq1.p1 gnl/TRDRNA2_/TRDRNA2_154199_c0~~gnl/TRDRNA2_/TRDRNA2_154199_c0_seq1.p1  ORF type:complete len:313 (-),score=50.32 gnl/TRDRNA2_/TRDRNA2_154199_c0_seq1:354-1292(-)